MAVLVGKKAPLFEADAVVNGGDFVEKFSLEQFIGKRVVQHRHLGRQPGIVVKGDAICRGIGLGILEDTGRVRHRILEVVIKDPDLRPDVPPLEFGFDLF